MAVDNARGSQAPGSVVRRLGENTRAVHLPPAPVPAQRPIGTPVYRTATFAFGSSAEYAAVLNDVTAKRAKLGHLL